MNDEVQRTWFHHLSHAKVKGLIRGVKGLELNKPPNTFSNKVLCGRIQRKVLKSE
jgi:hypothetical protein